MDPVLPTGTRVSFSALDYAALKDIGWTVSGSTASTTPQSPFSPPTTTPAPTVPTPTAPKSTPSTGSPGQPPGAIAPAPHHATVTTTPANHALGGRALYLTEDEWDAPFGGPMVERHH